jgi:hypothetical protein
MDVEHPVFAIARSVAPGSRYQLVNAKATRRSVEVASRSSKNSRRHNLTGRGQAKKTAFLRND